jgi:ssDNA thymidine ADP-ribosyltransferase, DarT
MLSSDYLAGSIYHMVHFENLRQIFQHRAILSKEKVAQEGISYQSIAYGSVQSLRDRINVWDFSEKRFRPLHSYVPFYFATHTPMLYVQHKNGLQDEIVIFEISRSVLKEQGVIFTDGNASNQQLGQFTAEIVVIVPATVSQNICRRYYRPVGRPMGSNPNRSDFYADVAFLDRLNWNIINGRNFTEDEEKRIKHAEVLIPDLLPLRKVQGIYVRTRDKAQAVNTLIAECGLAERIPSALFKPDLFF